MADKGQAKKLNDDALKTGVMPNVEMIEASEGQRLGSLLIVERQAHVNTLQKLIDTQKALSEAKRQSAHELASLHERIYELGAEVAQLQAGIRGDANNALMEEYGLRDGDKIRRDFEGFKGKWMLKRSEVAPSRQKAAEGAG